MDSDREPEHSCRSVDVRVDIIAIDFDDDIVVGDATDAVAANVFFYQRFTHKWCHNRTFDFEYSM